MKRKRVIRLKQVNVGGLLSHILYGASIPHCCYCLHLLLAFTVYPLEGRCGEVSPIIYRDSAGHSVYAADAERSRLTAMIKSRMEIYIMERLTMDAENMEDGAGRDISGEVEEMIEAVMEYYEGLFQRPININRAGRRELERLYLLSGYQIESIVDYRKRSGNILTPAELQSLNGFDKETVELLLPVISFEGSMDSQYWEGSDGNGGEWPFANFLSKWRSTLQVELSRGIGYDEMFAPITEEMLENSPESRYLGSPYHFRLKYGAGFGRKVSAGFTLESDEGEYLFAKGYPIVDFASFHITLKEIGVLRRLVVGDYSVRYGQGLTLWNSFSFGLSPEPQSIFRRGESVRPHTSSAEYGFFRGVATSLSLENFEFSGMVSYKGVDANVKGGRYSAIYKTGLHNTRGTIAKKGTMDELVCGVSLSYLGELFNIGLAWGMYGYNKKNGRRVSDYNRYQIYDGLWGNIGVNFYTILRKARIFGEVASDYGGEMAAIAGVILPTLGRWEWSILLRAYSRGYISPHAGAYTTLSTISNQYGVTVKGSYRPNYRSALYVGAQYSCYPWKRYYADDSSFKIELTGKYEYKGLGSSRYLSIVTSYDSYLQKNNILFKLAFNFRLSPSLSLSYGGSLKGVAWVSDKRYGAVGFQNTISCNMELWSGRIGCSSGVTYFNVPDWNCRLYQYEKELPGRYNNRLLYGEGGCCHILLNFHPLKWMEGRFRIFVKGEQELCFKRISSSGNGKEPDTRLKLAVNITAF